MPSTSKQFAVITGASTGIGPELAKLFAQHDYHRLPVRGAQIQRSSGAG